MSSSDFYVLGGLGQPKTPYDTEFIQEDPVHHGPAPRCHTCGALQGTRQWVPPHRAELELWGTEFGDVALGSSESLLV